MFVLPNLDYCSVVWNSCGAVLSSGIEWIQNYALRLILHKPSFMSSADLQEALRIDDSQDKETQCNAMLGLSVLEERSSQLPHIQISH